MVIFGVENIMSGVFLQFQPRPDRLIAAKLLRRRPSKNLHKQEEKDSFAATVFMNVGRDLLFPALPVAGSAR